MARQSSLQIETPEGVTFSFRLATPVARALAWAFDGAIIIAISTAFGKVSGVAGLLGADWVNALTVLLYFIVSMGYGIVLEWHWRGQTLGKRLFGLRVVDAQGFRLQRTQVVLRNLLRSVDLLPLFYLVGGTACLLGRNSQRLGDLAANTIVVREPRLPEPDLEQIAPAKYNSLLMYPHLAARLRSRVRPEAVRIAVAAITLRDGYEPAARVELFHELAGYFRSLVEFPETIIESLTDEQYVRSAVRVIFSAKSHLQERSR